jgi:hypothetical protein
VRGQYHRDTGGGRICVCIPVCQAHRLLDPNPLVRVLAEEILLVMGRRERAYLAWAAGRAGPELRARIGQVMQSIDDGGRPNPVRWPTVERCAPLLDHRDEVVALLGAQMLQLQQMLRGARLGDALARRVAVRLEASGRRPWYLRSGDAPGGDGSFAE